MKATGSTLFTTREIFVNEIEFRSKDEVHLFGFLHDCGKFYETQYLISRNDLKTLLSRNKAGIEVLWHIEKLFVHPHSSPASINLIDLFGTTQVFEAWAIKIDTPVVPHHVLQAGRHGGLLFIESVIPFPASVQTSF